MYRKNLVIRLKKLSSFSKYWQIGTINFYEYKNWDYDSGPGIIPSIPSRDPGI
jgi:hypothetical protein